MLNIESNDQNDRILHSLSAFLLDGLGTITLLFARPLELKESLQEPIAQKSH